MLQYEIETDRFVYLHEVLKELKRVCSTLNLPTFDILYVRNLKQKIKRALSVLANDVPTYFDKSELPDTDTSLIPQNFPFDTVRDIVQHTWNYKQRKPDIIEERVKGYQAAFKQDIHEFSKRNNKSIQFRDKIEWMKSYLKLDRLLTAMNTGADVDELLGKVDVSRCPSVQLFFKTREKKIRAANPIHKNDADDWLSLHIVPYADLFLTDKGFKTFILQADSGLANKVTHDPVKAVEILAKWGGKRGHP